MITFTSIPAAFDSDQISAALLAGGATSGLVPQNVSLVAEDGQVSFFSGGGDVIGLDAGIVLTSGDGTPPDANTFPDYTVQHGTPGDPELDAAVQRAFQGGGTTFDAAILEFELAVPEGEADAAVSFDVVFASEEYPEFSSDFVDIGIVSMNGENVALFDGNETRPLSVLNTNLAEGFFVDNLDGDLPIEYDGISVRLQASAPLVPGLNTVKIAVGDTRDAQLDSALFVGNVQLVGGDGGSLNRPPEAEDDAYMVTQGGTLSVPAPALLANDVDPDGETLTAQIETPPAAGGLDLSSDGSFTYTPDPGFSGTDIFTYRAVDDQEAVDIASVTVEVLPSGAEPSLELPETLAVGEAGPATLTLEDPEPTLVALSAERGLFADPLSGAFSETVFLLGGGSGGPETIDVDVRGTAGPRSTIDAEARLADPGAITDIAARVAAFLPAYVEDAVAARLEANVADRLGETVAGLASALGEGAEGLGSFGLPMASATAALAYAVEGAGDFGSLQERGLVGSMSPGWASLTDLGLQIDGPSVRMTGLTDIDALRALSPDAAALYAVSASAGRSVTLAGDALAYAPPPRASFEQQPDGSFATTSAFDGTLTKTVGGYALILDDGDALIFDQDGAFLRLETPDGLQIVASRDGDGAITALAGPNGARLDFTRGADGAVQSITDADGETVALSYDGAGRLDTVTRAEGQSSFAYDAQGDLTEATAPGSITAAFAYDDAGRLAAASYGGGSQTETFGYDGASGLTITDGAGVVTEIDLLPGGLAGRVVDGEGNASEVFYGENGELAGVRAPDGTETTFEFDDQGRLIAITDANGAALAFGYEGTREEPASFTDAGGATRAFAYDAGGRITEATWPDGTALTFEYDAEGDLTSYANRRGDDVTYDYDARGRLTSESDGSAGPTTYAYDAQGRLVSATSDRGTTTLTHDDADRVTLIEHPDGRSLAFTYDEAGLRSSMTDGEGYAVFYDYDAAGRLTGLADTDGPLVAYAYDEGGRLVREDNSNGTATVYVYAAAGRLTLIENLAPDDSVSSRSAYAYDDAGQRVGLDTLDGSWSYGYDAVGQLTSAEFASTNPAIPDKAIAYDYDAAGNRTRVVEDGVETLYESNALNQYTRVGDATFTYDADGNMTSRTDGDGTTTYAYDVDNRLVGVTDADGTVLAFEYDVFNNRVAKTVDGARTEYLVDPFGLGDVVGEFADGEAVASYAHGLGLAAAEIGGQTAWYDADAVGSVTGLTDASGALVNRYAYTPFGEELLEVEGLANAYEFNGALGVAEDADDLTYMRERSYDPGLGRFLGEDPLWANGQIENLNSFALNSPVGTFDPEGKIAFLIPFAYPAYVAAVGTLSVLGGVTSANSIAEAVVDIEQGNNLGAALNIADAAAGFFSFGLGVASAPARKAVLETVGGLGGSTNAAAKFFDFAELLAERGVQQFAKEGIGILNEITGDPKGRYGPDSNADGFPDEWGPDIDGDGLPDNIPQGVSLVQPVPSDVPPIPATKPTDIDPADGDTRTYGDPHLITFDRTAYSFQAAGEFTLVIGTGFEIQVRMEPVTDEASANTAVAMCAGEDVVAVYAREAIPLVVNGTAVVLAQEESLAVGDLTLHRTGRGDPEDLADAEYIVTDASGNGYYVRVFDGAANISPFVSDDAPVAGLLGNLDDDRSNDFALRDGTVLDLPLPQTVLYGAYADSWRIEQADSLFLYREGESTETFTDRGFPSRFVTLEDLDPAAVAEAKTIALAAGLEPGTFEFETTVLDIALTGNTTYAEALADVPDFTPPEEDEPVEPVALNEAPRLPNAPAVTLGPDGTFTIDVLTGTTDPEGDPLTLVPGIDAGGGVVALEGDLVRFTPADGFEGPTEVSYVVADGQGNEVEGMVTIDVGSDGPTDPRRVQLSGPSEEVAFDGGILVLERFDVDEDGAETTSDTATFAFGGVDYALNSAADVFEITEIIETDGDGATDAFFTVSGDLVFVFARTEAGGVEEALVLEGAVGRDGLTLDELRLRGIDEAFRFEDEDDAILGVVVPEPVEGGLFV